MGSVPGDFNEDGLTDVLVYYWGRTPVLFIRNDDGAAGGLAPGSYTPSELMPTAERWYTNAAAQADLDGDGHLDLVIGNYFPDGARILDAHGTASRRCSIRCRAPSTAAPSGCCSGREPEAPEAADRPSPTPMPAALCRMRISHGWTLALGMADLDGDFLPEIYFANDFGPDRLMHNRSTPGHLSFALLHGRKDFDTPKSKVLGDDSFKGMGSISPI